MQEKLGFCVVEKARDDIAVDEALFAPVQAAAENAARLEGIEAYEAYIVLADDDFLHELNRQYRDVDRSTDVLSFPENELDEPLRKALDEGDCRKWMWRGKRIAPGGYLYSPWSRPPGRARNMETRWRRNYASWLCMECCTSWDMTICRRKKPSCGANKEARWAENEIYQQREPCLCGDRACL